MKSGVPAADQLAQRIMRWAWCLAHGRDVHDLTVVRSDWWPWIEAQTWFDRSADLSDLYPVIMEKLLGVRDKRREFLAHMIRPAEMAPAVGYEALTNLLHENLITTVLTSNFDQRVEEARANLGRPHALTVIRTPDDLIRFNTAPRAPQLLYLHGSVEHYSDKNLASEVVRIDPAIAGALAPLLRDHPIIVVGYRGSEPSIMTGLFQDLVTKTGGFLRGVYWCVRGEARFDSLHPRVQAFANAIGSNFQLISIRGFDELFSEDLWPALASAVRTNRIQAAAPPIPEPPYDMRGALEFRIDQIDHHLLQARLTQYAHQLGVALPPTPDDAWALDQARERHLIADHAGKACATRAGWLLFAARPQTAMPNAGIEFVANGPEEWVKTTFGEERSNGTHDNAEAISITRSIDGHLWHQLSTSLDLLALANTAFRLKEARSRNVYPYHPQALKEIVVNALVHRDYAQDEPVRIEVMPDRIRVLNPGGITSDVQDQTGEATLEQAIRSGRRGIKGYRNPVISDLFYGGQEMDPKGSGLADVVELCRANNCDVRFGPSDDNTHFSVEIFARPEAVDAVTRTAVVADRAQVRYAANLLAVVTMPTKVWHAEIIDRPSPGAAPSSGRTAQIPAFIDGTRCFSFYDLSRAADFGDHRLAAAEAEELTVQEFIALPSGERGLVRLLNLAFADHLESCGLIVEQDRRRTYFPKDPDGERQFSYQGRIRKATRTVVKARRRAVGGEVVYWEHKALGYQFMRFGAEWAVVLTPGYAFTLDGVRRSLGRDRVNILSTRRAARDYNPTVHFDLNFWAAVLATEEGEKFALNSTLGWPGPRPLIELSAQPPTISALEPVGRDEPIKDEDFEELDAEIADLARNAEDEESEAEEGGDEP